MKYTFLNMIIIFLFSFCFTYLISLVSIKYFKSLSCKTKPELKDFQKGKDGTPNVGGISFLIGAIVTILFFVPLTNQVNYLLLSILSFSILGLSDDLLKIKTDNGDGLTPRVKFALQYLIAFLLVYYGDSNNIIGLKLSIFNTSSIFSITLRRFVMTFFIVYFVNAFNITDGIDGLAASITLPIIGVLIMIIVSMSNNTSLVMFLFAFLAAILAFLHFNKHPASYFMGDCGSLALGSLLVNIALILRIAPLFFVATLMFSIELFTSLIQIIAIRKFNRKVFLIAPIHHMFEMKGKKETLIVKEFFYLSSFFSIISLIAYAHFYL